MLFRSIVRTIFIKVKFGLSPFTMKNLKVLIITVGVFFAANFVDSSLALNEIFNLIIVGTFTTVLFWSIILKLNISEDFSVVINKFFKSFVNR